MSRGMFSGTVYVTVEIPFDKAWDDLSDDEQKEYVESNIEMVDDNTLISELERRGYTVKPDE